MNRKYIEGKYDPFTLNSILFDKRAPFGNLIPASFNQKSFLWCYWYLVKVFFSIIIKVPFRYKFASVQECQPYFDGSILFFLPTVNNQRALNKVVERVKERKNNVVFLKEAFSYKVFPILRILLFSIKYLPVLRNKFSRCSQNDRKIFLYYKFDLIFAPGIIWLFHQILSRFRPESVILSNDHRIFTKSLELVCEDFGIKTIYVQHASVSYAFPELHFTYSFLDGMDSFRKYTDAGKKTLGSVFLLGSARYDMLSNYRIHRIQTKRNCIGIAINLLDNNKIVNDCCNKLLEIDPLIQLKIRTHPLLKNNPFHFDNKDRIIYTCAIDEDIMDYFDSIDLQIGGDSAVHFDSIIGGIKTVAFNFSSEQYRDNYGYVRNGLIEYAEDFDQLMKIINKETIFDVAKIRFYDESYGKSYSGKCSEIIADFILNDYDINYLMTNAGFKEVLGKNHYYVIPN